ncbi:cupin domain-containing protein [Roseomonas sp. KE2513]|uniref:cupin domain-containing protein n=1 Tax=Roseomonas sp. KE2513 TaxID=2479202 RepID=UPI0018E009BA|nr:cupin domain-containing protein [Roseomonas sp. KE2513]MBI0534625.1 cupin domain-containing protein [Roseomonas sp. KE2513]
MLDVMDRPVGVQAPGEGEALDVFGAKMVVKAEPGSHGLFLGEHLTPPGFFVPPHVHGEDTEVFYILEGELTVFDGVAERRHGPGTTVTLPAGSRHAFRNDTAGLVRFLVMATPGVQSLEMFRHFDRAGRAAPGGLTPPEIGAICGQYGVNMG